jgi:DNA primase
MADQVEEVKQKSDIVSVVGEFVELKKAGRNFKANCPFHGERVPSFMVSPELQIFKCFGCGESGDVISFLEKYEGMEFYEALKYLADRAQVKLKPTRFGQRGEKEKLYRVNSYALKFYRYVLLNHKAGKIALSYLTNQRGLKVSTIKLFELGYAPDLPYAIRGFLVKKKGYEDADLEKVGIAYKTQRGFVDRFRGRVVFPLHDHRGNVAGFAGRTLPSRESGEYAKYINSPETVVYHKSSLLYGLNLTKSEIKRKNKAVVVEGELDLISSYQVGIKNIVALKGSAFTQEQAKLISRFANKATLSLDADIAGDAAARRGISIAEEAGLEVSVVKLENYKDPDDIARKNPSLYKKMLSKPTGVWDYIVNSVIDKYDLKSGVGKARVSRELMPILAAIPDNIVKAHYVGIVAKKLGVSDEAVIKQISKITPASEVGTEEIVDERKVKTRRELLEERLLSLALQKDPGALLKNKKRLFKTPFTKTVLIQIFKYLEKRRWDTKKFIRKLPAELSEGVNEIYFSGEIFTDQSKKSISNEVDEIEMELKILDVKEKLGKVAGQIKEHEKKQDKINLRRKQKEFAKLTNDLSDLEENKL